MFESLRPDHTKMNFIIYKYRKSPTQSGEIHKDYWVIEPKDIKVVKKDLLTGWKSTENNLIKKLKFNSKNEAIAYAKNNKYNFEVLKEDIKETQTKIYADNFKYKRVRTDI